MLGWYERNRQIHFIMCVSCNRRFWSVPKDFDYHNSQQKQPTLAVGWQLWLKGQPKRGIRPYRAMNGRDLPRTKGPSGKHNEYWMRARHSDWNSVFNPLVKAAELKHGPLATKAVNVTEEMVSGKWFTAAKTYLAARVQYALNTPGHKDWAVTQWAKAVKTNQIWKYGTEADKKHPDLPPQKISKSKA
jgi:hypothetical protein